MEDNIEKYIREYILKMIYTAKSEIAYFVSSEIENLNKDSQISASETINGAIDYFNKLENYNLEVYGNYLILCISNDANQANDIIKQYID